MSISFVNGYSSPVSICLVWYSPKCSNPPFEKAGWWNLQRGQSITILRGPLSQPVLLFLRRSSGRRVLGRTEPPSPGHQ